MQPGNYSWNGSYALACANAFDLDLMNDDVRLSVEIAEPILYDDVFNRQKSGKVLVRSSSGLRELNYQDDSKYSY